MPIVEVSETFRLTELVEDAYWRLKDEEPAETEELEDKRAAIVSALDEILASPAPGAGPTRTDAAAARRAHDSAGRT